MGKEKWGNTIVGQLRISVHVAIKAIHLAQM